MKNKSGFTLIELMIVIAIIGILLGATFKLMGVAQDAKARAVTTARLERLQNALSGYHSAYGMYPAVPIYQNPELQQLTTDSDTGDALSSGSPKAATTCARAQPMAFEYPTPISLDEMVEGRTKLQNILNSDTAISINKVVDSLDPDDTSWSNYKGFKFGLMSFILPRVAIVGLPDSAQGPLSEVFLKAQWRANNPISKMPNGTPSQLLVNQLSRQQDLELECKRWLPNLENMVSSFKKDIYGIKIGAGGGHGLVKRGKKEADSSENTIYLAQTTITDGWGREFFYYSAPPHQSFRIWSAGPDGYTFPPWEKLTSTSEAWIKDDIVGGKL